MPRCRHTGSLVLLALALIAALLAPNGAGAWPATLEAVGANPADTLARLPLDAIEYDHATRCSRARRPGMERLTAWLARNHRGTSWGTYRCEKWGKREASLHAEGRALDWHLDVGDPADRRAADRLIAQLLAPDREGRPRALARRMGVQEIIWDCRYWGAGMDEPRPYGPCLSKAGRIKRIVNATIAHRDHVHIGLSKLGAMARTSFWTRKAPPRPEPDPEPEAEPEWAPQPSFAPPYEEPAEEPESDGGWFEDGEF